MSDQVRISELFVSIQGEGMLAGAPSVFVRLAGCPLRSKWCDTPYALSARGGKRMPVEQVIDEVERHDCRYVVITGGEPLIWPQLGRMTDMLHERGCHITVETAGVEYRRFYCDLLSVSPKLPNSLPDGSRRSVISKHRRLIESPAAIRRLLKEHPQYQLKFVVFVRSDLDDVERFLQRLDHFDPSRVMLMPQAADRPAYRRLAPKVAAWAVESGWRFCPRLQVELFGGRRGV